MAPLPEIILIDFDYRPNRRSRGRRVANLLDHYAFAAAFASRDRGIRLHIYRPDDHTRSVNP